MSMPEFPATDPSLTREEAINQIISSIAMEELGLSHIINAEGEKLQYVLGTIEGLSGPGATIDEVLKVNESVRAVLDSAAESQTILKSKLQSALSSPVIKGATGPTGPTGPTGFTGADGKTVTINAGNANPLPFGSMPTVTNRGTFDNAIFDFGIPAGEPGENGLSAYEVAVKKGYKGSEDEWLASLVGPKGPAAAIFPFSIGKYGVNLSTDEHGEPSMVAFSGFGPAYYVSDYLHEGEWATGTFTIHEDMNYSTAFIMPNDGSLKKLHVLFSIEDNYAFETGSVIRPFICLAVSNADTLTFTILQETMTFTDSFTGGMSYPKHTIRKGVSTGLNVEISEGTLVAIVVGMTAENTTTEQNAMFAVSGGLYIE